MGLGVEELMAWQPNPARLDLNHQPSLIIFIIEKFQLVQGVEPGSAPLSCL
jgi:hypothetical protein